MIEFRNVSKQYETKDSMIQALSNVHVSVDKGDIFGIIGLSGAGKSTLLRTINLLEAPTSGEVLVEGKNLATLPVKQLRVEQKKIGMIFQHFHLLSSKTVYQNVAIPLLLSKVPKSVVDQKVKETLAFVGLSDKINQYPDQLSGGQKQRVGIARALVTNPHILLCDEATSALDPQTTVSILKLLKEINERYAITIVMITHQMEVLKEICNRVAVMEDGKIIETASLLDIVTNPQQATTKTFVQSIVQDGVPKGVKEIIRQLDGAYEVYSFRMIGPQVDQPILSHLIQQYNLEMNILYGNMTEIQGVPFGQFIIALKGEEEAMKEALTTVRKKSVYVKEVDMDGD